MSCLFKFCFLTCLAGRRVLESYLLLLLSASSQLTPAHDLEQIVARTLNSYILGEHVGSAWGLGQIMYWTPSVKASKLESKKVNSTALLRSVGLYKVQGETVAAVVGGTFREFVCHSSCIFDPRLLQPFKGGSTAHRIFHTRVLPHLLLSQRDVGLPELFHRDARAACAEMGGIHGPLLSSN